MVDLSTMKKRAYAQIILRRIGAALFVVLIAIDFVNGWSWVRKYQSQASQAQGIVSVPITALIKTYRAQEDPSIHVDILRYRGYLYVNVYRSKQRNTFRQARIKETQPIQASQISVETEFKPASSSSSPAKVGIDVEMLGKQGIFYQKHFDVKLIDSVKE